MSLTVYASQEFIKLLESLWLQSDINWGCSHLKACLVLAEPLPRCFTLKTAKLVPLHVGYSGVFMTWQLACPRVSKAGDQGGNYNASYNLALKAYVVTSAVFHWPLKSSLIQLVWIDRHEYSETSLFRKHLGDWSPFQLHM